MPRFCGVFGCSNRENKVKRSFFRLPAARKYIDPDLTRLRRLKWLAAIRREDLTELKMKYLWVCEDHFISGRPADYRDIENPDWVPSLNMGYEQSHLADCFFESSSESVDCLNAEDKTDKQKKGMFITGQIILNCSEAARPQDILKTTMDSSFSNSERLDQSSPRIYSGANKENASMNLISHHKKISLKETLTFKILLKNWEFILKPNLLWGISPHSDVVICARWTENYICEKKVVIDNSLTAKIFLKAMEINLSELMNISCISDISDLLEKVERYTIS